MNRYIPILTIVFIILSACGKNDKIVSCEEPWLPGLLWCDTLDRNLCHISEIPYAALDVKRYSVEKINELYGEPINIEKMALINARPQIDYKREAFWLYENVHPDTADKYFKDKECTVVEYTWKVPFDEDDVYLRLYYLQTERGLIQLWGEQSWNIMMDNDPFGWEDK